MSDYASLSAHKCYGPKGIGALYRRNQPRKGLRPMLFGGEQQASLRPGTPNLASAWALTSAIEHVCTHYHTHRKHIDSLHYLLMRALPATITLNGSHTHRVAHNINITLPHHVCKQRVQALKERFQISSFSACNQSPTSPILHALGVPAHDHQRTLRIGLGLQHTPEQVASLGRAIEKTCT